MTMTNQEQNEQVETTQEPAVAMNPPVQNTVAEPQIDWKVKFAGALGAVAIIVIFLGIFVASGIKSAQDTISDIERASNQTELEDGWTVFDGEDFRAEFPAEVLTASEQFPATDETIELETYQAASVNGSAFTISLLKMTTEESELEAALESAVNAGASTGGGTLVEETYEPVENGEARASYKVDYSGEGVTQEAYLVATTERFYQVIVIYENGGESEEDLQRFFDSFEIK